MRRIRSSGSVKAISLDRNEILQRLQEVAIEALKAFPELQEVRLIGSLATGTPAGTSDVDLLLRVTEISGNPLEAMKPYFFFFSRHLDVGLDLLLSGPELPSGLVEAVRGSILLAARGN